MDQIIVYFDVFGGLSFDEWQEEDEKWEICVIISKTVQLTDTECRKLVSVKMFSSNKYKLKLNITLNCPPTWKKFEYTFW